MRTFRFKIPVLSAIVFFGTLGVLSVGYAALSTGLSTSDRTNTGSTLTSSAWNKLVNSVLELDTRTVAGGSARIARFTGTSLNGSSGTRQIELSATEYNTSGYTLAGNTVTIANAGYYRIYGVFGFDAPDNSTNTSHYLYLYKNGGATVKVLDHFNGAGAISGAYANDTATLNGQYTGYFNAGDTVSLYTNCTTTATTTFYGTPISLEIQAL